jgi:hypothetical protein
MGTDFSEFLARHGTSILSSATSSSGPALSSSPARLRGWESEGRREGEGGREGEERRLGEERRKGGTAAGLVDGVERWGRVVGKRQARKVYRVSSVFVPCSVSVLLRLLPLFASQGYLSRICSPLYIRNSASGRSILREVSGAGLFDSVASPRDY